MADQTTVSYDRRKDVSSLILESHQSCREDYAIDLHASIKTQRSMSGGAEFPRSHIMVCVNRRHGLRKVALSGWEEVRTSVASNDRGRNGQPSSG
jgi:hypothetical protein